MSSLNKAAQTQPTTHGGGPAKAITASQELRRSVLACLLWEDTFYESGQDIATRIQELCKRVDPVEVANLAVEARNDMKLRHVPLLLVDSLAKQRIHSSLLGRTVTEVCQRPDDMTELLAIYWHDCLGLDQQHKVRPIPNQYRIGLGNAFRKFDEYQLAKYNRSGPVTLKNVLFLTRPKPKTAKEKQLWEKLANDGLATPQTWETRRSSGEDPKIMFEDMLRNKKLGYMALLRNLRNMKQADVDHKLVNDALQSGAMHSKALPFRFIAAANAVPQWEHMIDTAMQLAMGNIEPLSGRTTIVVDISSSMGQSLSSKSDMSRRDAAIALAILIAGITEDFHVIAFHDHVHNVASRKGIALRDAINKCGTGMTDLPAAVREANKTNPDRMIVITDEQSTVYNKVPDPVKRGYMINVASYQNGVGYGKWNSITGFSENVVEWMRELEKLENERNN